MSDRTQTITPEQQAHWDKGQEIADDFEALASDVARRLPGVNESVVVKLRQQVGALRDFLAGSHLPGENKEADRA